jgi:hypothetical protein
MGQVALTEYQIKEELEKMDTDDFVRLLHTQSSVLKAESNQELIEKAVIVTTALAASGKLNPKQAQKFINYVFDLTELSGKARTFSFRNEQMDIDKISVHKRVAVKFTEKTDPALRRGVNHSKVSLAPVKFMVPFEISDDYLLINIEGLSVEETIVKMMAIQFANDLEDLYINGDKVGRPALESDLVEGGSTTAYIRDTFLGSVDGWLRRADFGTQYNAANSANVKNIMAGALKALNKKYKKRRSGLTWIASPDLIVNLTQNLTEFNSPLADLAFMGQIQKLTPYGVPVIEAPVFDLRPVVTQTVTFTGSGSTVSLRYGHIANLVVIVNTLAGTPTNAYVPTTDYTFNATTGTITHAGVGSGIGATETVLLAYTVNPQLLLTYPSNLLVGLGLDVTIESDRQIFTQCNQWAMTVKADANLEEVEAMVKAYDIQDAFI